MFVFISQIHKYKFAPKELWKNHYIQNFVLYALMLRGLQAWQFFSLTVAFKSLVFLLCKINCLFFYPCFKI